MGKRKERFNAKARASSKGPGPKKASRAKHHDLHTTSETVTDDPMDVHVHSSDGYNDHYEKSSTEIPTLIEPNDRSMEHDPSKGEYPEKLEEAISSKKRKRLEKFIEKQLKKEERVKLFQKLSQDTFSSDLLQSSKSFSRKMTAKERLRQAFKEEKAGIPQSDSSVRLYVDRHEVAVSDEGEEEGKDGQIQLSTSPAILSLQESSLASPGVLGGELKTSYTNLGTFGAGLKSSDAPPHLGAFGAGLKSKSTPSLSAKPPLSKKRRGLPVEEAKAKQPSIFDSDFESDETDDSDSTEDKGSPLKNEGVESSISGNSVSEEKNPRKKNGPTSVNLKTTEPKHPAKSKAAGQQLTPPGTANRKPAFFVPVNRSEEITLKRVELPVVGEEQQIMEAILAHDCVILCGETGSGKTTQVPQFLYEAGFGDPRHTEFKGMVGVTQPRRVAAVSMANRVAQEMNLKSGEVAYQIRYDSSTVNSRTRIKFMTDGILLRELSGAIGINAKKNTMMDESSRDLLLSKYSCIIIDEAHERTIGTDILIGWLTRIVALRNTGRIEGIGPLKLVIMSATLRVEDFTHNSALFSEKKPPLVKVDGRQYKVVVHYNRVTPEVDYVSEAFKKVSKIHKKLPPGGILVFLTGKAEITYLTSQLKQAFKDKKSPAIPNSTTESKSKGGRASFFEEGEDDEDDEDVLFPNMDRMGEDDFDAMQSEDDEEEEVHVLAGQDGETEEEQEVEESQKSDMPLYVLPLYSALPTAAQLRVFQDPPAGSRLCIVATNIAETSITIPGIKYVVDCGKVKERRHENRTGVQNYQVGWTSQASADQRAGRAGRVGPGHCYRLFSSAVFANYFDTFSKPEILRVPIEGVILQMKAMGISNVQNFPFPTPPSPDGLRKGERLLMHLGALTRGENGQPSKITELGNLLASYPISPRYAKMLVIASSQSKRILEYLIAIVAGLTVGEILVKQDDLHDERDEDDKNDDEDKRRKRSGFHRVMNLFDGDIPESDAFSVLRAIGAYSVANFKSPSSAEQFCESHFLRSKAMEEVGRLRDQLTDIVKSQNPSAAAIVSVLSPPTPEELAKIRQIMVAGFPDHIAKLEGTRIVNEKTKKTSAFYTTMWAEKGQTFRIHASSALNKRQAPAQWLIYEEIVKKEDRLNADNTKFTPGAATADPAKPVVNEPAANLYLKNVTLISEKWIGKTGSETLIHYAKFLEQPEPRYAKSKDSMVAFCNPNYGPKLWELPICEVPFQGGESYVWFAKELLEGNVPLSKDCNSAKGNFFTQVLPFLVSKPIVVTKSWARTQAKVMQLVGVFSGSGVASRSALLAKWQENRMFMLEAFLPWLPHSLHAAVEVFWPPVTFEEERRQGNIVVKEKDIKRFTLGKLIETIAATDKRPNSAKAAVMRDDSDVDSD
ncbi:ATP-dependent RNA helicase dhx37 [Dinochytrium kinnereticum]|nr:ATP-dependent RNA helicase dhx37 [Dinochytrium kinnereticum]